MYASSSIFGVVTGLVLLAAPAFARSWAGPVDMNEACAHQYGAGWTSSLADDGDAFDWSCVNATGGSNSVNVDAHCAQKYGNNAYADPQGGDAYDWGCYFQ